MSDNVNGTVKISDGDWIAPLEAEDGFMFECQPDGAYFDEIVSTLNNASIIGEDNSDSFNSVYVADYTYSGDPMRITVTEYESGTVVVLVQIKPE